MAVNNSNTNDHHTKYDYNRTRRLRVTFNKVTLIKKYLICGFPIGFSNKYKPILC